MDYSLYRFRAEVDWIEIAIETATSTDFKMVRRHGGFSFVKPIDPNAGGGALRFLCRIQNPKNHMQVKRSIDKLEEAIVLFAEPTVSAIEISLDAYSKGATREELAELAARFYKFLTKPTSKNRRFVGRWKGDTCSIYGGFDRVRRMVSDGRVIAIGNQIDSPLGRWLVDPISYRIYFKTTDKANNKKAVPLPENEHRARIEITMQGNAVPVTKFSELLYFRFESLTEWFRFRTLKEDIEPTLKLAIEYAEQVGERKKRWRVKNDATGYSGSRLYFENTKSDIALNDRAKGALRTLSNRWGN